MTTGDIQNVWRLRIRPSVKEQTHGRCDEECHTLELMIPLMTNHLQQFNKSSFVCFLFSLSRESIFQQYRRIIIKYKQQYRKKKRIYDNNLYTIYRRRTKEGEKKDL